MNDIAVLRKTDGRYPPLLREITDPPSVLYVRGAPISLLGQTDRIVSVVGTRKMSPYGCLMASEIARGLVEAGCVIVSGMALGIDAVAHEIALDHGGKTIAVLGCGVDVIAPPSNEYLYRRIIQSRQGLIVSEIPLGVRSPKERFKTRNRIISGLSRAIVVIEGDEHSGTMITARYAAEQGRDVFAVPGPATSLMSRGPLKLIRDGAIIATSARDILDEIA